ncbi:carbohydrate-binding protein [Aquimarina algiphila]|uniref:carbohydrate-binding protein n=1 Tax=Aquimarina algiphila TaxID=2047982 RepID=UPI00232EC6A5|nr:carbohydrate-binding protein [Aquimarina algiphila]
MKNVFLILFLFSITLSYAQPPEPKNGYRWVLWDQYSDEFNGTELDRSKWRDSFQGWKGRAPAKFDPSTISVQGGNMQIRNKKLATPDGPYTIGGGAVQSLEKTAYFGYYECKFKASRIAMSTTFWMSNPKRNIIGPTKLSGDCAKDKWSQELDICESIGGSFNGGSKFRTQMNFNTHYRYVDCNGAPEKFYSAGNNAVEGNGQQANADLVGSESWEDFHTYGCYWRNDKVVDFYVDDNFAGTVNVRRDVVDSPFSKPMGINMVTETYNWAKPYPSNAQLANNAINTSYYDWIRSYRLIPIFDPEFQNTANRPTKPAIFKEEIKWSNTPVVDIANKKVTVSYVYKANLDRDLVIHVYDANQNEVFSKKISALEGFGKNQYVATVNSSLPAGNYTVVADIRPVGGSDAQVIAKTDGSVTSPNPTSIAIPGTIQAEKFIIKNGEVKTENTPGGGQNLGFIKNNNYTEYDINVATAGSYKLEAFVSSNGVGGNIVASVGGNNLATLTVPVNNEWHNYNTPVSGNLNLASGVQKIRFTYTGSTGFLFNFDRAVLSLNTPVGSADCSVAPSGLAVSSVTNNSVTFSFDNTTNDTRTFELRAFPQGGFNGDINTGGVGFAAAAAGSTTVTMINLQADTSYDFVFRALCSGGTPGTTALVTSTGTTSGGNSTTPETITLAPINDTYLQGGSNYNNTIVRIEKGKRVGYLMYDLSGINGTITDAKLKFTVTGDAGNGNLNVNLGNSNNWNEINLSNNNKPASGTLLGSINKTYTIGQTETVDLQASSISGNSLSLVLSATSGNDFAFAAKENSGSTAPQLVVTYQSSKSGINDVNSFGQKALLFPNPAKDIIQLSGVSKNATVTISDISGKLVRVKMKSEKNARELNVSDLKSGMYFVIIKENQNKKVLRFSKK